MPDEPEEAPEVEDDDPEYDLGDVRAKKSEILAWKAGEMKDADYRRKTAEAAEVKRAAQAEREQVQQERTQYANQLDVLIHGLQTQLIGDSQALAQLAEEDPAAWVAENARFQQRYGKLQQAVQERQAIANRDRAEQEAQTQEWRKSEREKLREKVPEWSDPAKAAAEQRLVAEFLIDVGYSKEELTDLFDHRALIVARDAAKWRQHQAAVKSAKDKQAKPEPGKAVKPGAAPSKQTEGTQTYRDALSKARKSGRDDDVMALLAAKRVK